MSYGSTDTEEPVVDTYSDVDSQLTDQQEAVDDTQVEELVAGFSEDEDNVEKKTHTYGKLDFNGQTRISEMHMAPIVIIDLTESIASAKEVGDDQDKRDQLTNYHHYNIWNAFSKASSNGVKGIFHPLMENVKREFELLKDSRIILLAKDEDEVNTQLHDLFSSYLERALSDLYISSVDKYDVDSGSNLTPMVYGEFEKGLGIDSYLSLVEHDHVDDTGSVEVVNNIVIRFSLKIPALGAAKAPDKFLTAVSRILKSQATARMPFSIGVLMSASDIGTPYGMSVLKFCQAHMDFVAREDYIDMLRKHEDISKSDDRNHVRYLSLIREYPVLTSRGGQSTPDADAEWVYRGNKNSLLFLEKLKCVVRPKPPRRKRVVKTTDAV